VKVTYDAVTAEEASALTGWRVLRHHLHTTLRTGGMSLGAAIVDRIVAVAEELDHHPDLDLRYASLHVSVTTHVRGTLTRADLVLAERVSRIAEEFGVPLEPTGTSDVEVCVAAADPELVRPFWRAVLGYKDDDGELSDPHARLPHLWILRLADDAPRPGPIHLDVHVPHDVAESRVEAAIAAGGRLVSTEHTPGRWVLADPEATEVCVCTWQDHVWAQDRR